MTHKLYCRLLHNLGLKYRWRRPLLSAMRAVELHRKAEQVVAETVERCADVARMSLDSCEQPDCVEERAETGYSSCPGGRLARKVESVIRKLSPATIAADVERMREDAENYRWLRANCRVTAEARGGCPEHAALVYYYGLKTPNDRTSYTAEGLDAAIKAARSKEKVS